MVTENEKFNIGAGFPPRPKGLGFHPVKEMKCTKCSQVKTPWEFSFSIKLSKYYDTCKECIRKKRAPRERARIGKKCALFDGSLYYRPPSKKGDECLLNHQVDP